MASQEIARLRRAHERRLAVLEEQQASYGLDCPPHIITEIEDIRRKLDEYDLADRVVNGGAVSKEVLAILRQIAPNEALIKTQFIQSEQIRDQGKAITANTAAIERVEERVDGLGHSILAGFETARRELLIIVRIGGIAALLFLLVLVWLAERVVQ